MKSNFLLFSVLFFSFSFAQDSLVERVKVDFSGYIDTYYSYDFGKPTQKRKQSFLYNYNRHNTFGVNLALLRATISYDNIYAKLSFHAGSYVDDNYVNEDLKIVNEAYLGVYLDQNRKTTLEVGILPSYIGFETAISHSNLTTTRSILAENSPYFMSGLKLNYQFSEHCIFSALLTNGWQRIDKPDNTIAPAIGTQIIYKPSDKSTLNWSTFIGKEYFQDEMTMRYFSNFYWDKQWNSKWRAILGFDFGIQDSATLTNKSSYWMSPVLIAQYTINSKWQTAVRFEYYQDDDNVIIASPVAFKASGVSWNFDYLPTSKVKFRTEARYLDSKESIFSATKSNSFFITSSLSFEF